MRISSKGQVRIPRAIREKAGLLPHGEVEFELRDNGEVVIRPVPAVVGRVRAAFARVRGSANAVQFKGMSTDQFMNLLRG